MFFYLPTEYQHTNSHMHFALHVRNSNSNFHILLHPFTLSLALSFALYAERPFHYILYALKWINVDTNLFTCKAIVLRFIRFNEMLSKMQSQSCLHSLFWLLVLLLPCWCFLFFFIFSCFGGSLFILIESIRKSPTAFA